MSDNNELSLLGEDLGDDDYDLGNEDEDALLADDYEREEYTVDGQDSAEHQTEYQEYEEPLDDVLDLGVTDGLDDLDSEIQDTGDDTSVPKRQPVMQQDAKKSHIATFIKKEVVHEPSADVSGSINQSSSFESEIKTEEADTHLESEEEDEGGDGEGRGRFKSERTNIVSLKSGKTYGNIPDSLDNVIPVDDNASQKQHKRDGNQWRNRRGRGSGPRGGARQHFHNKKQQQQQQLQQPAHFPGPMFGPGPGFMRHPHPQPPPPPPPQLAPAPPPVHHMHPPPPPPPQQQQQQQMPPPPPQMSGPLPGPPHMSGPPQHPHQHQPQPQPPHKILINPHFRGAVQPHPEARLIWDPEPPPALSAGDGLLPFPPPYGSGGQAGYEHGYQQPQQHEPAMFPSPPVSQHQPMQQPAAQQYYHHDMYPDQQQQQMPPQPPMHSAPPSQGAEYWHDVPPPLVQGPGPHGRDSFYPQHPEGVFAPPQYGPGPGMPSHQEPPPFPMQQMEPGPPPGHLLGHPPGPPQPAVWQGVALPESVHVPAGQAATLPFPNTQGMFRMANPNGGPFPGPGMCFRQPAPRHFRNFNQPRPRFAGSPNGPRRRMPGPPQLAPGQPGPQSPEGQPQPPALPQGQQNFRSPPKRPSFDTSNNVVPLTHGRFDPAPKRKKRMPDMSNLHEVQTVDTLPMQPETEVQDENEDEETREYRKKIEEQKRLRERVLQQKEARRKLAALEKQRELQKKEFDVQVGGDAPAHFVSQGDPPQGNAIATIVNRNTVEPPSAPVVRPVLQTPATAAVPSRGAPSLAVGLRQRGGLRGRGVRGRGRGAGRGQAAAGGGVKQQPAARTELAQTAVVAQQKQQPLQVQSGAPSPLPALGQRIVRATMKPVPVPVSQAPKRVVVTAAPPQRVVQAQGPRTVMLRGANSTLLPAKQLAPAGQPPQQPQRRVVQSAMMNRTVISSQNSGFTVAAQTADSTPAPRTKLVAVENLAASTTDTQLRRMCQRVGVVENIQMIPAQRRAVITFANPASALTFIKRYQRKMCKNVVVRSKYNSRYVMIQYRRYSGNCECFTCWSTFCSVWGISNGLFHQMA